MTAIIILIGYLLGSFPSGYLAGKSIAGIDIRKHGSGSTGATNVLRHVGKTAAISVFILDVGKGALSVFIAKAILQNETLEVITGIAALVGHIWPIWLRWQGGKAVATGLGMLLGLTWPVGLASLGIFLTALTFSRIVSLSSLITAASLPWLMLFSFENFNIKPAYLSLSLITMVIVIWRHKSNIKRLLAGKEPKIGQSS